MWIALGSDKLTNIPQHIHQVFFYITDKKLPKVYQENQNSWRNQNPGYSYTLWNVTMIEELIRNKYPEIEELYHGYNHWDVATPVRGIQCGY